MQALAIHAEPRIVGSQNPVCLPKKLGSARINQAFNIRNTATTKEKL